MPNKQEGWNLIVSLIKRFGWSFWCRTVLMHVMFCSVQRTAGKRFSTSFHPHTVYFDNNAAWKESILRQFTFHEPNGVVTETHIMIRLLDDVKHEMLSVEAINVDDKDWVFVCVAKMVHSAVRMWWVWNLSHLKQMPWHILIYVWVFQLWCCKCACKKCPDLNWVTANSRHM